MVVYVVNYEDGNYDGRGDFCGVFSTKEKAQEFINRYDKRDREGFDIGECVVDEELK